MNKEATKPDRTDSEVTYCHVTNLPLLCLPQFTNVHNNGDYYISLTKIGESIVYIKSRGSLKSFDLKKSELLINQFCIAAKIKLPYVSIIDLKNVTGRVSYETMRKQVQSFNLNQGSMTGVVYIDSPAWFKPIISHGFRLLKPKQFKLALSDNYADAIAAAQKILDSNTQNQSGTFFSGQPKPIGFNNLVHKKDWEYYNADNGFRYSVGCIPGYLLYAKIQGTTKNTNDIKKVISLLEKTIIENEISGIPYMIADYSETGNVPVHIRQVYAKEIKKLSAKTQNTGITQFIIGATSYNKNAMRLFSPFVKRKFVFVDSLEEAFESINKFPEGIKSDEKRDIYVSAADLEEISKAFGLMQWDNTGTISDVKVSTDNPLSYLAESLELIRSDINEMRKNEKKINENHLKESEESRRQLLSMMEDTDAAKTALEKEEEAKRILLDNIQIQIWYLTDETTYGAVNKAHADFKGMKQKDMAFKSLYDLFPESTVNQWKERNAHVFKSKKPAISKNWLLNAAGEKRFISISKTPKLRPDGTVEYVVCSAIDFTEQKHAEEQIKLQNIRLNELNTQKDKFFSIIAHDLKSPFNSIIGFSGLLIEQIQEKDYEGIEEYARVIQKASKQTFDLLINLLEWSRAQTGRMEFNPDFFALASVIEETLSLLDDMAAQKSIKIKTNYQKNISIFADKPMISTVFRNLLSNAVKFTKPGGEIIITAESLNNEMVFSVIDNGVGIAKNRIDSLFELDKVYSTVDTNNQKGTGLGLILCKEFIEKHNGTIWVKSTENQGSVFSFSLPLKTL